MCYGLCDDEPFFPRCSSSPAPSRSRDSCKGGSMDRTAIADRALITRRKAIGGGLVALSALFLPEAASARGKAVPDDSFVLLLKGLYQPVVHGPDLGLSTVNLSDGSYSTTRIYPVNGTPGNTNPNKPIGNFYVQFVG